MGVEKVETDAGWVGAIDVKEVWFLWAMESQFKELVEYRLLSNISFNVIAAVEIIESLRLFLLMELNYDRLRVKANGLADNDEHSTNVKDNRVLIILRFMENVLLSQSYLLEDARYVREVSERNLCCKT